MAGLNDALWAEALVALASDAPGPALCALADRTTRSQVGAKLFTIMTSDPVAGLAARIYTDDPVHYPVSGTKPIVANRWTATVLDGKKPFIANTIEAIAEVFPDHPLIASLGCGSVVNVPVIMGGGVIGTANILHEAGWYTPERVEAAMALQPLYAFALLASGGPGVSPR